MFEHGPYKEILQPDHGYLLTTVPCPTDMGGCGKTEDIFIKGPDLYKIRQGADITVAAPYVTRDQAERFITGFCPKCWDKIFKG